MTWMLREKTISEYSYIITKYQHDVRKERRRPGLVDFDEVSTNKRAYTVVDLVTLLPYCITPISEDNARRVQAAMLICAASTSNHVHVPALLRSNGITCLTRFLEPRAISHPSQQLPSRRYYQSQLYSRGGRMWLPAPSIYHFRNSLTS